MGWLSCSACRPCVDYRARACDCFCCQPYICAAIRKSSSPTRSLTSVCSRRCLVSVDDTHIVDVPDPSRVCWRDCCWFPLFTFPTFPTIAGRFDACVKRTKVHAPLPSKPREDPPPYYGLTRILVHGVGARAHSFRYMHYFSMPNGDVVIAFELPFSPPNRVLTR